jgi:hypothetical protein
MLALPTREPGAMSIPVRCISGRTRTHITRSVAVRPSFRPRRCCFAEMTGFEPATCWTQTNRPPKLGYISVKNCPGERIRTSDLSLPKRARYLAAPHPDYVISSVFNEQIGFRPTSCWRGRARTDDHRLNRPELLPSELLSNQIRMKTIVNL